MTVKNTPFARLGIVLLGVASPADLIDDQDRTPFNIGQRIDLQELPRVRAEVLENGLREKFPKTSKAILDRIFYWTGGHPYLTQKLCSEVMQAKRITWTDSDIDNLVHTLFIADDVKGESNIKFVSEKLLSDDNSRQLLEIYRRIYNGKKTADKPNSPNQTQLKLSRHCQNREREHRCSKRDL